MKQPFELEWMGGASEHHFRKVRPTTEELPWGTLDPTKFLPAAVERARGSWTEVAINEYRAIASFSEVLRALVDVKAPLDLLGMTSDFLADECSHVELASRLAMELGGGAPRYLDVEKMTKRPQGGTPLQRANDLLLRVSCVSEAFTGGTASVSCAATTHELPRAVYETILRDEALHRRLGGLYFEWALAKIDDAELARLGRILAASLRAFMPFWRLRPAKGRVTELGASERDDLQALGWLGPSRFAPIARDVVLRDIVGPLATIGIALTEEEHRELFDEAAEQAPTV